MIKKVNYVCEYCGNVFKNEEECLQHEKLHHLCFCQGGLKNAPPYDNLHIILGYAQSTNLKLDLPNKCIKLLYEHERSSNVTRYHREIEINNCPFCGRSLGD